ncbi:DUF6531 domain-containing protein [Streptomyces sp. NPDC087300]|uniref:DUF6531 domain-containing protein n=1 Tax=Streptomyces sp. NPDC087300 TaxID=3365780 RepID=UPI00380209B5
MGGHRPSDWHVLDLEKDPTPGDPHRVRSLSKNLHDFADDVGRVLRDIKGMAGEDAILRWAGKTADAFTEKFEDAPAKLKKLKKSYEMAGDALSAYWPELERAQTLADKALVKGREAQADLSSAKSRLSSADSWVERAGKEADKYKDDGGSKSKNVPPPDPDKVKAATRNATSADKAQTTAKSDVSSAQGALAAAKKMAEDARKIREDAASTAKRKIDEASDAGIRNRKWWEEIGDWVSDNWDTIVAVCKVVVAIVGIIAMIVGGPILAAIVIVAGAIVLADTLSKYAKGQATLMDVAFAALDCIPGMKGITTAAKLGKGLKGLKGGLKGFKSARTALKDGAKGAFNRVKSKIKGCGDPVDVATGQMFLTETDVTLPGTLPLVFTRRVASGYRSGGWFGPTWTSTLDQRLEADEEGLVFVTEDGMLLAYPHPETPGTPVLPESGPRWPLTATGEGGYRLTDPVTGHTRHFAPPTDGDDVALLARITDRNHNTIDFAYDTEGAPTAIRHSGGYHLTLTVEDERVTVLSLADPDPDGTDTVLKRYGYTDGNLTAVTNSSGLPLRFTYDEHRRLTAWQDTNDSRYTYTYDEQDRCTGQQGIAGHMANTFTYDLPDPARPDCRITEITTAEGATTRVTINAHCLIVAETDPLGATVTTAYDTHHNVSATTDQLGHTTAYVNNELGQPVERTGPDGAVVRYAYNELNLVTSIALADGTSWRYGYDERGNCTELTDSAGTTSRSTYTPAGHPLTVTDALGRVTTVRCDPAGLPLEIIDAIGSTFLRRDAFGRSVALADESGRTTRLAWSREGLLIGRTTPDSATETWTYDGEGNCTSHTDQSGHTTFSEYTHFDLLSARTDPDGARYEFGYDPSLRLTQVAAPGGLTWSYRYDAAGQLISETDFDGRTLVYAHDAAGRLTSRTNALGQTIAFEHSVLGQVLRKDADGAVTTFGYDQLGNLTHAVGPDSTLVLELDSSGRPLAETVDGRRLAYAYDEAGLPVGRTTPSGATSSWAYDEAGRLARLTASGRVIGFDRDPSGRTEARRIGTSVTLVHAFDEVGRLTSQSVTGIDGRAVQHRSYAYRADGGLTGIDDRASGSRRFELDPMGRVTAVRAPNWTETYAYDSAGNVAHSDWPRTHPGHEATGARTYAGTRISRAGDIRYEHDDLGRMTLRQKRRLSRGPDTWRYEWDVEDRLTAVVTPDGVRWRYTYDPLGRRTAKLRMASDGETVVERVDFTWDGINLCEQSTTSAEFSHQVVLTWDYQGLTPVSQTERLTVAGAPDEEIDSRFFAIVTDLVGTPTELIDETGEIAWRARSTLWGTTTWDSGAAAYTPLRFPGQYFDPETGLHYNHFRYYDPQIARYLTQDPLGLAPGPNPASYVRNPLTWVDPLGLTPCEDAAKQAAARNETVLGKGIPVREEGAVGSTTSHSYKKTFFDAHPALKGKVVVHHAIEQQVLKRYPNLFSADEIHSLENLRGIPKGDINSKVHLSAIRVEWNKFYNANPAPTRQEVLDHVSKVDDKLGNWFQPRIR